MSQVHLIGNAHLDPVWLWRLPEGYAETRATFRSALERMKEFPEFIFTCAGAGAYRWIEESDPVMFRELRQRVEEGRWVIVGGWWVQPDCNLPGGESFARQGLYAQRYFASRFGVRATVGYNVDSFGHAATLPQILRLSGMDHYVMMRPDPVENPRIPEGSFWWEGPDGSRVLTHRLLSPYCIWGPVRERAEAVIGKLTPQQPAWMAFFGVGNHGGGPTVAQLQEIRALQSEFSGCELRHSSPPTFFAAMQTSTGDLPVWREELQHHASGCYLTRVDLKRMNRLCEHRLLVAELWNTIMAQAAPVPAATARFAAVWQNVLFNQFHDIMGGCSIASALEDARTDYGEALAVAAREENRALQNLAARIDTRGEGWPLVVFNPNAFPVRAQVTTEMQRPPQNTPAAALSLRDEAGNPVDVQASATSFVQSSPATLNGRLRYGFTFEAELPPMGYRVYRAVFTEPEAVAEDGTAAQPSPGVAEAGTDSLLGVEDAGRPPETALRQEKLSSPFALNYVTEVDGRRALRLENRELLLELDGRSGALRRLFDKTLGAELLAAPAQTLVVEDRYDAWGHGVTAFREVCGRFGEARVQIIEEGPLRIVARVVSTYNRSRLIQDYVLSAQGRRVEVRALLNWQEEHRICKLSFPLALREAVSTWEVPYGAITRPATGEEEPFQRWVDLSGRLPGSVAGGLGVVNDGFCSGDALDSELRLSVVRSCVHAHHCEPELREGEVYPYMSLGELPFAYVLLPHAGDCPQAELTRQAQLLMQPPTSLPEYLHEGTLPPQHSFAGLEGAEGENLLLTVLKYAEPPMPLSAETTAGEAQCATTESSSPDRIVRIVETSGQSGRGCLRMRCGAALREVPLSLRPYEIQTLRISADQNRPVTLCNLLEEKA